MAQDRILLAQPRQLLGCIFMRAYKEIGFPVLPLPARQAGQSDSQIVRYLHDGAATRLGQPNCFSPEIFRKYASLSFAHRVLLLRQTLSESPSTFPG